MLGNYLTTALRLLWRERGYAAINIFGLAVGFALCLLIIQLADYQLSVGDFPQKKRPGLSACWGQSVIQELQATSGYSATYARYRWGRPSRSNCPKSRRRFAFSRSGPKSAAGRGQGRESPMKRLLTAEDRRFRHVQLATLAR